MLEKRKGLVVSERKLLTIPLADIDMVGPNARAKASEGARIPFYGSATSDLGKSLFADFRFPSAQKSTK